jgi:hypothetical protein
VFTFSHHSAGKYLANYKWLGTTLNYHTGVDEEITNLLNSGNGYSH